MSLRFLTVLPPLHPASPTQIPNLVLWLDAADITTLYQDSSLTTPVTANGQKVGGWRDKSGYGYNATQSVNANRLTYSASQLNGKGGVIQTGLLSFDIPHVFKQTTLPFTIVFITRVQVFPSPGNDQVFWTWASNGSVNGGIYEFYDSKIKCSANSSWKSACVNFLPITNQPLNMIHSYAGTNPTDIASYKFYLNQVQQTLVSDTDQSFSLSVNNTGLPASTNVNASIAFNEILIYQRQLSVSDLAILNAYTTGKWGI